MPLILTLALMVYVLNGEKRGNTDTPVAAEETCPTWISSSIMNNIHLYSPPKSSLWPASCLGGMASPFMSFQVTLFREEFSPETIFKMIIKFL